MKKILLATPTMHTEEQQYIQKAFETHSEQNLDIQLSNFVFLRFFKAA